MFKLQFLGTSSGVPTKSRNVSGIALALPENNAWVLVDCGEGTQHQLLHTNFTLPSLKAIFITHVHGDHCYGLPGLIASAGMAGRKEPLTIVGPREIEEFFKAIASTTDLYIPFEIKFIHTDKLDSLSLDGAEITKIKLSHRVESHAFVFSGTKCSNKLCVDKLERDGIPKGPVWGALQRGEDLTLEDGTFIKADNYIERTTITRKIIIAGDNDSPDLLMPEASDADVVVHEATYTEAMSLKIGSWPQHSSAKCIAEFAESSKVPNLVLTHFSPRYGDSERNQGIEVLEAEARQYYHGALHMAKDFNHYHLQDDGTFSRIDT